MADLNLIQTETLAANNFTLVFDKIPNVEFHCRQVPLPNMSISQIQHHTDEAISPFPSNIINKDPFALMFPVDEDLKNYIEIYKWMKELTQNNYNYEEHTSDCTVILNTNNNNSNVIFTYTDCWPMNLGEIVLNTTDDSVELLCNAIFTFDTFDLVKESDE